MVDPERIPHLIYEGIARVDEMLSIPSWLLYYESDIALQIHMIVLTAARSLDGSQSYANVLAKGRF